MQHNGKAIEIEYCSFPDRVHGFIGAFVIDDDNGYYIGIDNRNAPIVQRFALGHELAHIFLNHNMPRLSDYNGKLRKELQGMEREANRRAWEFYRLYRDELKERG